MTPDEQKVVGAADSEKKKADEIVEKKAAEENKKASRKKAEDLKSTDTVVIAFKNPVHVSEDGENRVDKQTIEQHVKFAFWEGLKKDAKGNPIYATLRGAKLVGYVNEEGEVSKF